MYDERVLRAEIYAHGKTPRQVSQDIGMNERTFYRKMRSGGWKIDEARDVIRAASIPLNRGADIFLT